MFRNHPMLFQNPGYAGGDTQLHMLIRRCCDSASSAEASLNDLISNLGMETVAYMSVVTNDNGHTPLDLIHSLYLRDGNIFEKFYQRMVELMKAYPAKDLHERLQLTTIMSPVDGMKNNRLKNNLRLAVYLANKVRKLIVSSSTHPSLNDADMDEIGRIHDEVASMRQEYRDSPCATDAITNIAHCVNKYKCGNCHEYSYAVVDRLRRIDPGLSAEIMHLVKGDHAFVVIDRKSGSELNNIASWGASAVVCDAWSGEVYLAEQLPFKLMNFENVSYTNNLTLNILSTYNPRFHRFGIVEKMAATASRPHRSVLFARAVAKMKRTVDDVRDLKPHAAKRSR